MISIQQLCSPSLRHVSALLACYGLFYLPLCHPIADDPRSTNVHLPFICILQIIKRKDDLLSAYSACYLAANSCIVDYNDRQLVYDLIFCSLLAASPGMQVWAVNEAVATQHKNKGSNPVDSVSLLGQLTSIIIILTCVSLSLYAFVVMSHCLDMLCVLRRRYADYRVKQKMSSLLGWFL